jgi:hypothetical protein
MEFRALLLHYAVQKNDKQRKKFINIGKFTFINSAHKCPYALVFLASIYI